MVKLNIQHLLNPIHDEQLVARRSHSNTQRQQEVMNTHRRLELYEHKYNLFLQLRRTILASIRHRNKLRVEELARRAKFARHWMMLRLHNRAFLLQQMRWARGRREFHYFVAYRIGAKKLLRGYNTAIQRFGLQYEFRERNRLRYTMTWEYKVGMNKLIWAKSKKVVLAFLRDHNR